MDAYSLACEDCDQFDLGARRCRHVACRESIRFRIADLKLQIDKEKEKNERLQGELVGQECDTKLWKEQTEKYRDAFRAARDENEMLLEFFNAVAALDKAGADHKQNDSTAPIMHNIRRVEAARTACLSICSETDAGRCHYTCPHGYRCTLPEGHDMGHNHRGCECNEPDTYTDCAVEYFGLDDPRMMEEAVGRLQEHTESVIQKKRSDDADRLKRTKNKINEILLSFSDGHITQIGDDDARVIIAAIDGLNEV